MNEKIKPNLSRKQLAQIPLSNQCKSVVLGSLLGDGSLKKEQKYSNCRFKFRHSEVQADYFYWKVDLIKEIATNKSVERQKPDRSGFSLNHKLLFQSGARSELTQVWEVIGGNTMDIRRRWLNHLTPLSLAVWWFDDGSLTAQKRKGVICTDNFSIEKCQLLAQYLDSMWDVKCNLKPVIRKKKPENHYTRDKYYRLWFNNTQLRKFLAIVLPYAETPFTVKKCLLIYRDPDYQQRWISEMTSLLPQKGKTVLNTLDLNEFSTESIDLSLDLCNQED